MRKAKHTIALSARVRVNLIKGAARKNQLNLINLNSRHARISSIYSQKLALSCKHDAATRRGSHEKNITHAAPPQHHLVLVPSNSGAARRALSCVHMIAALTLPSASATPSHM